MFKQVSPYDNHLYSASRYSITDVPLCQRTLLRAVTGNREDSTMDPAGYLTTHARQVLFIHSHHSWSTTHALVEININVFLASCITWQLLCKPF